MRTSLLFILFLQGISGIFAQDRIYVISNFEGMNFKTFGTETCLYDSACFISYLEGGKIFTDIAFTPDDKLYAMVSTSEVYRIDPDDCTYEPICTLPFKGIGYPSLEALNDSVLLTDVKDTLYAVNVHTCSCTPLGKIGYEPYADGELGLKSDGDLAWSGNYLYTVAAGNLFRIELNEEGTAIVSSTLVNDPDIDPPIPVSWGLVSYTTGTNNNKLLSFGPETTVYAIDPETGLADSFCTNPYTVEDPEFTYPFGAAIRPPGPDDTTTALHGPAPKADILIYPNPVSNGRLLIKAAGINLGNARVSLVNIQGRREDVHCQASLHEIAIVLPDNSPDGTYFVEIITDSGILRRKISVRNQ